MTMIQKDPNNYIGSVFIWEEQKVKEIMQDIVNFTKQSDNNIKWNGYGRDNKHRRKHAS